MLLPSGQWAHGPHHLHLRPEQFPWSQSGIFVPSRTNFPACSGLGAPQQRWSSKAQMVYYLVSGSDIPMATSSPVQSQFSAVQAGFVQEGIKVQYERDTSHVLLTAGEQRLEQWVDTSSLLELAAHASRGWNAAGCKECKIKEIKSITCSSCDQLRFEYCVATEASCCSSGT